MYILRDIRATCIKEVSSCRTSVEISTGAASRNMVPIVYLTSKIKFEYLAVIRRTTLVMDPVSHNSTTSDGIHRA